MSIDTKLCSTNQVHYTAPPQMKNSFYISKPLSHHLETSSPAPGAGLPSSQISPLSAWRKCPLAGGIIHWVFLMPVNDKKPQPLKGDPAPVQPFLLSSLLCWQARNDLNPWRGDPVSTAALFCDVLALMKSNPTTQGWILHQPFALSFAKILSAVPYLLLIWKEGYI